MVVEDPGRQPNITEIEDFFQNLTLLMYDTEVALSVLEERVCPYLAPDVGFSDPWLRARGLARFKTGLFGFHCAFRFDFTIRQLGVRLNPSGDGGRVLVEGVMNLRSIPGYVYPLRTILVYDFVFVGVEPDITSQEEMWSFADLFLNAPLLVGRFYDGLFRPAAGVFFLGFFRLACYLRRRPSSGGEA